MLMLMLVMVMVMMSGSCGPVIVLETSRHVGICSK